MSIAIACLQLQHRPTCLSHGLVGEPLSSVVMQVSALIDHKGTCTCRASAPVVHQASSRLCRQLSIYTGNLLALE